MSYTLIYEKPHAEGVHRSGWPFIYKRLAARAEKEVCKKILLDDFFDMNHSRPVCQERYAAPWVGIFHFPREVLGSPIKHDLQQTVFNVLNRANQAHFKTLRGVICLSQDLADGLRADPRMAGKPFIVLKHPTDFACTPWLEQARPCRKLFQVGFYLRDTRAVYKIARVSSFTYYRSQPYMQWMLNRDKALLKWWKGKELHARTYPKVYDLERLEDAEYDNMLATSVNLSHVFGASANNVVVECIARAAPLVINPMPAVVEYLGTDYPLYMRDDRNIKNFHQWCTDSDVRLAHEYLLQRRLAPEFQVDYFTEQVYDFCARIRDNH